MWNLNCIALPFVYTVVPAGGTPNITNITGINTTSIFLTWSDTTEAEFTNISLSEIFYHVKYGTTGGVFQVINVGNRSDFTVSNLTRNTEYQFEVRASAINGITPFYGQYGDPKIASPGMNMCNLLFYFSTFATYNICVFAASNSVR